ncbi:MAG: hypothetical protein LQ348_002259 [Seirophora lacunosa]|nr:MAG: hypothetical protein LQ348_002259 [Seirophora lacunosa]
MLLSTRLLYSLAILDAATCAHLEPRAGGCQDGYSKCAPRGAESTDPPSIGTDLAPLYTDLLTSVQDVGNVKRDLSYLLESRQSSSNLCCADGTLCLLLDGLNLPFCYVSRPRYIRQLRKINRKQDNYTTNYFLPGGTTGQIVSGNYNATNGRANLVSGDYTLSDGTTGNIYGSEESPERPNTATLPIPTQYTAAGSGSAIAATALGQVLTITTTIPGTTVDPSTVPPETVSPIVASTGTIEPATTRPGSTIPGSTVAPQTSTYTTTAASAPTAEGQGAAIAPAMGGAAGFGFLLFAIFGL